MLGISDPTRATLIFIMFYCGTVVRYKKTGTGFSLVLLPTSSTSSLPSLLPVLPAVGMTYTIWQLEGSTRLRQHSRISQHLETLCSGLERELCWSPLSYHQAGAPHRPRPSTPSIDPVCCFSVSPGLGLISDPVLLCPSCRLNPNVTCVCFVFKSLTPSFYSWYSPLVFRLFWSCTHTSLGIVHRFNTLTAREHKGNVCFVRYYCLTLCSFSLWASVLLYLTVSWPYWEADINHAEAHL